jgi:hypothetical protein
MDRKTYEHEWLSSRYSDSHRRHILQHIRFADFWYTQNGLFSELKDFTKEIAGEVGLELTSDEAWRWFGTGGFIDHDSTGSDVAGFALYAAKNITKQFLDEEKVDYRIFGQTHFQLDLEGAEKTWGASAAQGRIVRHRCYRRNGIMLPAAGICGWLVQWLREERTAKQIIDEANNYRASLGLNTELAMKFPRLLIETLEGMVLDGWVKTRFVEGEEPWPEFKLNYERFMHANRDVAALAE